MSEITITAKIQIVPDQTGACMLRDTIKAYTDACNHVSDYIFKTHDLKQASLHKTLYYDLRERFGIRSQMANSVMRTVIARYKSVMSDGYTWSNIEFTNGEYDLVWNRDYSLLKDVFSVNTLEGRLRLPYHKKGMEQYFNKDVYRFGTAKLVIHNNKFYLHIPVTCNVDDLSDSNVKCVVGIDRGVNFLVACYDSNHRTSFVSGGVVKQKRAHYKKLRMELQKRQTPSARRRLKQIGKRENRWMRDVNHCISKALVSQYPEGTLFVIEDLTGIRHVTEKVRIKDRYVMVSWAYYDLEEKLLYKARMHHQKVIKVDPRYTSQGCPRCGHIERNNRNKKLHTFCCKNCGYRSNDDRIAAMNLYQKGISYLMESQMNTVTIE